MESKDWRVRVVRTIKAAGKYYMKDIVRRFMPGVRRGKKSEVEWSVDVVMPITSMCLDLFGYFYSGGKSSAPSAVNFIRNYMGRVNCRYKKVGGLIYYLIRHGWIHKLWPNRIRLSDGTLMNIVLVPSRERASHLTLQKWWVGEPKSIELALVFNWPLFAEDVMAAIDIYVKELEGNDELARKAESALTNFRQPKTEVDIRKSKGIRKYVNAADLRYISNQRKLIESEPVRTAV